MAEDSKVPAKDEPAPNEEAPEELPEEVLPPEEETPATPTEPPTETPEEETPDDPSAETLKNRVKELEDENATLKAPPADKTQPKPGERVSMAQVFVNQVMPEARSKYIAEKDPSKQFDLVVETANLLVGAALNDHVTPKIQQLAAINTELMNELEIRDLRADAEFKGVEAQVRDRLKKVDWKTRAGETPVTDIFHLIRGAKKDGTKLAEKTPLGVDARKHLKDLAAGGGASPKPVGIRLTKEQETDFQAILNDGVNLTRAEYYAKWKSRADQAKAGGRKIPATYRG